jgi:putative tryptophan/tyrosine transport system substrate-binding protein
MRRREFIAGLGSAAAWPVVALAQQQTKPTVIWFDVRPGQPPREFVEAFRRGLAQFGLVEGRDVTVEYHTVDGHAERLPALAADLVRRRPAAIFAPTGSSALAAKAATQTIPIIFLAAADPVELGLVTSLNRPSGNLTGFAGLNTEIAAKRLELLHKAVPSAQSIALLTGPADSPNNQAETRFMQSAADALGLRLRVINVMVDTELTPVFVTLVDQQTGAIAVGASVTLSAKRDQILTLAARFALPTMYPRSFDARAGAVFSYGADVIEITFQAGIYTGRILKGEKPTDLPVVQSTKLEFVINLRTAKALGFQIPADVLALADEVIE